jgi:hypothetical protein
MKTATKLGDKIKKAMLWEIWDRNSAKSSGSAATPTDWCCASTLTAWAGGLLPDPGADAGGHHHRQPHPEARIFDLYAKLAADLDETSARISNLTKQIKVRGAYNAASPRSPTSSRPAIRR